MRTRASCGGVVESPFRSRKCTRKSCKKCKSRRDIWPDSRRSSYRATDCTLKTMHRGRAAAEFGGPWSAVSHLELPRRLSARRSCPAAEAAGPRRRSPPRRPAMPVRRAPRTAPAPRSFAATPDSNAPSSFDEPTKIELTDETRPNRCDGVSTCSSVDRTSTLTLSAIPLTPRSDDRERRSFATARTRRCTARTPRRRRAAFVRRA